MSIEIISPEFEVDIKPKDDKTLVRIIDITQGKIIFSKKFDLKTDEIIEKLREKLGELFV